MDRWVVTLDVWPHSTARGKPTDQAQVGRPRQTFVYEARDFADAVGRVDVLACGVEANPMVWRVRVVGLRMLGPDERVPTTRDEHRDEDLQAAAALRPPERPFAVGGGAQGGGRGPGAAATDGDDPGPGRGGAGPTGDAA